MRLLLSFFLLSYHKGGDKKNNNKKKQRMKNKKGKREGESNDIWLFQIKDRKSGKTTKYRIDMNKLEILEIKEEEGGTK